MKLSLDRKQIPLIAGGGMVLVVCAALAWYGVSHLLEESTHAQELVDRKANAEVANILGRTGGVAEAKKEIAQLDQLNASLEKQEEALIGPWKSSTIEASGEGKEWGKDANKWKDLLVKYNDEILKRSGKAGDLKRVVLAPNFYLGLEDFKQKSPNEDQVQALALQLSVSKRLVDSLFVAKEKAFEGYPTPCVLLKVVGPFGKASGPTEENRSPAKPQDKGEVIRDGYSILFESSPEVLFSFLNGLTKDSWLFIPTSLTLENEKESFPKRDELAGFFAPRPQAESSNPEPARGGPASQLPPLLLVLAGKEKVRVNLQVDFVQWRPTSLPEKKKTQETKP